MTSHAVAQRYAQAIFELGVETQSLASLADEIRVAADAYASSPEMRVLAQSPLIGETERVAAVDEIAQRLGLARLTRNALGVLSEHRRLAAIGAVSQSLAKLADEHAGIVRASVVSAEPLTDALCQRLQREIEQLTGKNVVLERRQDPALLAGIVVRVGDRVIDSSARARLQKLRSQLLSV
jgi:F-type H+-transporting ATPase subunit delta